MEQEIAEYINYLEKFKNAAENTIQSYSRDLNKLLIYLNIQKIYEIKAVNETIINSYILYLERNGLSPATVSRNIASLRSFFQFCVENEKITCNPAIRIKSPSVIRMDRGILLKEEIFRLLQQPIMDKPKGIRDFAMMNLYCFCGLQLNELLNIKLTDVYLKNDYLICRSRGKEKIISYPRRTKEALLLYLKDSREILLAGRDSSFLFINAFGKTLTRQGFWKLFKSYAKAAGIEKELSAKQIRDTCRIYTALDKAEKKDHIL